MKKALFKDSIKEIKNTYKRFISILLMAFLGVGFFAGIRAASPDMLDTLDQYYKEQNVYDIEIISTLGLTNEDIEAISRIENVETVDASFETDGKIEAGNKETIVKLLALGELNKPILLEGNLPTAENECLVEPDFLKANDKKIGDTIKVEIEKTKNDNGDEIEYLKNNELKIVGTVKSPLYISEDRGTSNLGAGKIDYYAYILKENVNAEIYTKIFVKVKDADKYITSEDEYEDYIEEVKNSIEEIKEERQIARKQGLVDIANQKITDAEKELNTQKQDAEAKIEDAEKELADARREIQNGEAEINKNKQNADRQFANAEYKIKDGYKELKTQENEFNTKKVEAEKGFAEAENKKLELQNNLNDLTTGISTMQTYLEEINEQIASIENSGNEDQLSALKKQKQTIEATISTYTTQKEQIMLGIEEIEIQVLNGKKELQDAETQIKNAYSELQRNEQELNATKTKTYAQIESARKEINNAKTKLESGEKELEESKVEFNQKIAEAESKLADAREKITDIEEPKWYILDRNSNAGYAGFIQDTKSIANVGKVFPLVFFAVAALISLTSMTRMVEEQRMQIGTLKALGYNQSQIISKYILYAGSASIIGGLTGMFVGFVSLPPILWELYKAMYQIADSISIGFKWKIGGIGLILITICIVGATLYATIKELKQVPAALMRPKAPKAGNRVMLERIPFIWKKLNFSKKVTVRNIFRYKKRFIMTIIGIFGCTALIVTGFGLKDSIGVVLPNQFEKVFNYDLQINLKNEDDIVQIKENEKIERVVETHMTSVKGVKDGHEEDIQVVVPKENFEGLININDVKTKELLELKENEIYLTDKVAQLLSVQSGDIIKLRNNDNEEYEVKITRIVENYLSHYMYMSKTTYENLTGEEYSTNVLLTQNIELTEIEEELLATELIKNDNVVGITKTTSVMKTLDDTLQLLNGVVVILIVSAGLLAFVVLYNLANVNISERIRELATIKVLGFYDREVYNYISRETTILTAIGIILGLIGGYFLNYFIIGTCETNILRFAKVVTPMSYLYAVVITVVFTIIVNIVTYFALKNINMISSLKSVE